MRKYPLLLVALLLGVVVLGGCDAQLSSYAAKVGSRSVQQSDLTSALEAASSDAGFACQLTNGGAAPVKGAGKGTYAIGLSDELLTLLIERDLLNIEIGRIKATISPIATELGTDQVESELGPQTSSDGSTPTCTESGASVVAKLPSSTRDALIEIWAAEDTVGSHLAGVALNSSALTSYAKSHVDVVSTACVSWIIVKTKASADTLSGDLKDGADFATIAKTHSIDTQTAPNGGAVGCFEPQALSGTPALEDSLEKLPTGAISTPISVQGEWVILMVTKRSTPSSLGVAEAVVDLKTSALSGILSGLAKSTKISIDPRYGTWAESSSGYAVQPPNGPATKLVPSPAAASPTGTTLPG